MTDPRIREAANAIECVLLVSGEPVRLDQLVEATQAPPEVVIAATELLQQEYADRGLEIQAVAGGYQLGTRPAYAEAVRRYLGAAGREPLSQAALETLAIVAYRQPITRPEIEALRGVRSEYILERLEERRVIKGVGRKQTVGRPILYGTTDAFLRYFGLRDLSDLPPIEAFGRGAPNAAAAGAPAPTDSKPRRTGGPAARAGPRGDRCCRGVGAAGRRRPRRTRWQCACPRGNGGHGPADLRGLRHPDGRAPRRGPLRARRGRAPPSGEHDEDPHGNHRPGAPAPGHDGADLQARGRAAVRQRHRPGGRGAVAGGRSAERADPRIGQRCGGGAGGGRRGGGGGRRPAAERKD